MLDERVQVLNNREVGKGAYVLYWMQAAQRAEANPALAHAVRHANRLRLPVVVLFCLVDDYPGANLRHYTFMLEGLVETRDRLADLSVRLVLHRGSPETGVVQHADEAALVVTDAGHLRHQRRWRDYLAACLPVAFHEVEANLVVPVEVASAKAEFSAATFRPRLHRQLDRFLVGHRQTRPRLSSLDLAVAGADLPALDECLAALKVDRSVGPSPLFRGGPAAARRRLDRFLRTRLDRYADERNDPTLDRLSHLSPYLHFGQISPVQAALRASRVGGEGAAAFLEELLVRRELAFNHVRYNPRYDAYAGLAAWARATLADHADDPREVTYTLRQFERAETHDPYWNAAQREMVLTGKMHGYMRMYWGKKILEWSRTPQIAYRTALTLNDKYELDGRDPNGYAGVAWCFGQHDRGWGEREVFGKVRYMNAAGLRRKFAIDRYVERVEALDG